MTSVRTMIKDYQKRLLEDLTPSEASKILVELSSILGNVNEEIKETQMAYNKILLAYLDEHMMASKAKISAEASDEYQRVLEAKNAEKVTIEMIRGLKYYLKVKLEEARNVM